MAWFTFREFIAYDPIGSGPVRSAAGQVYAATGEITIRLNPSFVKRSAS